MSSELERLLREGRTVLPDPDPETTERARARALSAVEARRVRRLRVTAMAVVALLVVAGLGIGIGVGLTPSGEASKGSVETRGLGFLPEPGWYSLQAPTLSPSDRPTVAMVANVPFAPEDGVNGLAEPSALPYATLLTLPPSGIVIVVSFIARSEETYALHRYTPRVLPLRMTDATPYIDAGTQVRPDAPLGQYQLRAAVNGQHVDVQVYFGTPRPGPKRRAEAQRQLAALVVRSAPSAETDTVARPASSGTASAPAVIDRTMRCATSPSGGIREVEARANAGIRLDDRWKQLPYAVASSGNVGSTLDPLGDALAWITAGRPSADTTADWGFRTAQVSKWGTLAVRRTCRTVEVDVPLSRRGLVGSPVSPFGEKLDCPAPRRVLVRVRAIATAKTALRARGSFLATNVPLRSGRLVVSTERGTPILYADVLESGAARLFTAKGCVFD